MGNSLDMNTQSLLRLAEDLRCRVMYDEPLSSHTTFKVGGPCTAMVDITSADALTQLVEEASALGLRTMAMGNGSNMLFDDKGYKGVIFLISNSFDKVYMKGEDILVAQAGCSLLKLCRYALEHSLSGLEFAYGIPGTVGGAVFMNAGAYGGEIKDVINLCRVIDPNGRELELDSGKLDMSYRHSRFCDSGEIVAEAEFKLTPGEHDDIQDKMVDLMSRRREKQPLNFPSAGSTFKRPEGAFAGKLIQDCGLRGYSVGGAQVSEKHCGFVVNKGGATCADILNLIEHVQKTVKKDTGYDLECEVRYIPYEA